VVELLMENIYFDPSDAVGFTGDARVLSARAKIKKKDAEDFLQSVDAYTLHRPVVRNFLRRKMICPGIDHLWQLDLAQFDSIMRENDNKAYILVAIDCFSRYMWTRVIKNKSAESVTDAFVDILNSSDRRPTYLQTDKGVEFKNALFQSYLRKNRIIFYTSENDDVKCSIVERAIRTLKQRLFRYFTHAKTYRYIEVLPQITSAYNSTVHRGIGISPENVNFKNQKKLFFAQHAGVRATVRFNFREGDSVRISESKKPFKKAYEGQWSRETFVIKSRFPTHPVTYSISDLNGEEIIGKFYEKELQRIRPSKVEENPLYAIEKILKTRRRRGKIEYFVRWLGYDSSFDSWVSNLTNTYK
jgi:hypothetical protein